MEKLLIAVLSNPKVQKLLIEMAVRIAPIVAEKLSALLPVVVAAAMKAFGEGVLSVLPGVALSELPALPELAETVRRSVNQIPDIDIPVVSDIFDLTEWLKSK